MVRAGQHMLSVCREASPEAEISASSASRGSARQPQDEEAHAAVLGVSFKGVKASKRNQACTSEHAQPSMHQQACTSEHAQVSMCK